MHLVCKEVLKQAVASRDYLITPDVLQEAVEVISSTLSTSSFQHFWEDGILDEGQVATRKSVERQRTLIALNDADDNIDGVKLEDVFSSTLASERTPEVVNEFVSRGVLVQTEDGRIRHRVPLFRSWLHERGAGAMLQGVEFRDHALDARRDEQKFRISDGDIRNLVKKWGTYRSRTLTVSDVREWLNQFGPNQKDQHLMFRLLQSLRFYSDRAQRLKLRSVTDLVQSAVKSRLHAPQVAEEQVLVSYLDGPGKSGPRLARMYCDSMQLPPDRVIERTALGSTLKNNENVRVVLVLDDMVGTGQAASTGLKQLHDDIGTIVRSRDIKVVFCTVVAHQSGLQVVHEKIEALQFGARAHALEILSADDEPFGPRSAVFPDPAERSQACRIATEAGARLERRDPKGYGDLGLCIIFEANAPNNSLPILWKRISKSGASWTPLFERNEGF